MSEFHSFGKLKDNAILLDLAKEYMCQDVFLEKIGRGITENIDLLKKDIDDLRRQYPGKFAIEVGTDEIIKKLESTAAGLLSGEDKIKSDVMSGKFCTALNSHLKEIKEGVNKIWVQVKGTELKYTRKEAIEGVIGRSQIFSGLGSLASFFGKIIAGLLVIVIAGFIYLYMTMEKESTYRRENEENNTFVEQQLNRVDEIEERKAELNERLAIENKKELTSKTKIAILDLEIKIQELNTELHDLEASISSRKASISKNSEKIEELKRKSLFEKLLRKK